ncbi:MAG: L-aspartate oxidase [Chloroflexi bacterium]|nr:L-aspartate oxidase [Chloroflexota bacterium]
MNHFDFIIVGSGIAGLYSAIQAREHGSVLIITKGSIEDCNTRYAQGGIAAAIGKNDSTELHLKDTIAAGDGLCNEEAVRIMVDEAPERIAELVQLGVPFDTLYGEIALAREAAHSVPRVAHAGGDATGEHIEVTLSTRVRSWKIRVLEFSLATRILVAGNTVQGVRVLDCRTGATEEFGCRYLILATGGAGQLFKYTTNSAVATGDGLTLAYDAGAEIIDMEFYQFHPTALRLPGVPPFLISEAVRGEGGILRNVKGERFMTDYSPNGDLATRDVVARSIVYEMEKTGADKVFIDVTQLPAPTVTTRFPNIYHFCLEHGLDITRELIPIAPAAHYLIGGVKTNTWGETNITGLFACGETACTGVHGANRLASNSLLEAVIFSKRIIRRVLGQTGPTLSGFEGSAPEDPPQTLDDIRTTLSSRPAQRKALPPRLSALQTLMWENIGIMRNLEGLSQAASILSTWQKLVPPPTDRPSYELSNLILAGRLMAEAALMREESRGAHFRSDFPQSSPHWQRHIIFTKPEGNPRTQT